MIAEIPTPAYVLNRRRPSDAWVLQQGRNRDARIASGRRLRDLSLSELLAEMVPMAGGATNFTLTLDTTAPGGASISINSAASYATSQNVTLTVTTSDSPTTNYTMLIWGDVDTADNANIQATEGASTYITFSASQAVKLSSGDGTKNLYCKIRDDVWNPTAQLTDGIVLDTTAPIPNITVAASPTKVSKISTKDTATVTWQADVHIQAYKVKVVPATNSLHSAGVQIPTTAGSTNVTGGTTNATTDVTTTIKGTDLETAGAEGSNIVKIFVQDDAGNWSV